MRIAIDLMGSDSLPSLLLEGALQVAKELPSSYTLVLLVEEGIIDASKSVFASSGALVEILFVQETIHMSEDPLLAVRRKKGSSIAVGLRLLAERKVDGFVSAGNTGALLTSALLSLPMLPGVERAALLAVLPTSIGNVVVLDVGANLSVKPQHLLQFARLGSAYQQIHYHKKVPKVGLLNVGTESKKGTLGLRKAYFQLQEHCQGSTQMEFIGNIEGSQVFQGGVDVLVTDGFSGNIFLKTSEGVSVFILKSIEKALSESSKDKAGKAIDDLHKTLNYAEYYGAILAGIDGLVIKVHGYSTQNAFCNGIKGAFRLAEERFIQRLKTHLDF